MRRVGANLVVGGALAGGIPYTFRLSKESNDRKGAMSEAKMTSKGQITVPKDVRLKLNLKPGDRLLFIVEDDAVWLRAANKDISSLIGILPPPKRRATSRGGSTRPSHRRLQTTRLAMIGIDTNVLLRLLVRDHDAQVRAAERFIAAHCSKADPGFVSRIVIAEIAWALGRFYRYERPEIAAAIRALLNVAKLEIESADEIHTAVTDFEGSTAGFADCLLARTNRSTGCEYTITFDRKAARLPGFKLLRRAPELARAAR